MNKSNTKINISCKILPFAHASVEIKSDENLKYEKIDEPVKYGMPTTTDTKTIEINFEGGNYKNPQTTCGIL